MGNVASRITHQPTGPETHCYSPTRYVSLNASPVDNVSPTPNE
jgi:hypothetical protein